jgi:hypothetical protein
VQHAENVQHAKNAHATNVHVKNAEKTKRRKVYKKDRAIKCTESNENQKKKVMEKWALEGTVAFQVILQSASLSLSLPLSLLTGDFAVHD